MIRICGPLKSRGCIVLMHLLSFPFSVQHDPFVVHALGDAAFAAHRHLVLSAVINQRLFMALAQQHGSGPFAPPQQGLPAGGACTVCSLCQDREGHVTPQNGSGCKLLIADGAPRANVVLALGVPVLGDALLTEGVAAGDGHRVPETLQAYGAVQIPILRLHL